MIKLLSNDAWKTEMFSSTYLKFSGLFKTEKQVRDYYLLPYGGFNDRESAERLCKTCLDSSVDNIAAWLAGRKRILSLRFYFFEPVGYTVVSKDAKKLSSNCLHLFLRKEAMSESNHGFYISSFNVI